MDDNRVFVPRLERHRCDDCRVTTLVRYFHDSECNGVHSCYLCDECSGLSRRGVSRDEKGHWFVAINEGDES